MEDFLHDLNCLYGVKGNMPNDLKINCLSTRTRLLLHQILETLRSGHDQAIFFSVRAPEVLLRFFRRIATTPTMMQKSINLENMPTPALSVEMDKTASV